MTNVHIYFYNATVPLAAHNGKLKRAGDAAAVRESLLCTLAVPKRSLFCTVIWWLMDCDWSALLVVISIDDCVVCNVPCWERRVIIPPLRR